MEELEGVEISDVLVGILRTNEEDFDSIFTKLLHQQRVSCVGRVFEANHTDQVKVLAKLEENLIILVLHV